MPRGIYIRTEEMKKNVGRPKGSLGKKKAKKVKSVKKQEVEEPEVETEEIEPKDYD